MFSESACTLRYNGCSAKTESELQNKIMSASSYDNYIKYLKRLVKRNVSAINLMSEK